MDKFYEYTIHLEPAEEGGFAVYVPSLPGCFTQGETEEEAIANAQEAIQCHIAGMIKAGEAIPDEASTRQIKIRVSAA